MPSRKTKQLTDVTIRSLKVPGRVSDGDGLWLQVSKWQTKSWLFQFTVRGTGRVRQMGLGPYPSVSLAKAREATQAAWQLVRAGSDPIDVRRDEIASKAAERARIITFKQCALEYVARRDAEWKNAKHRAQWASTLSTYAFPNLGSMSVHDITQDDVLSIMEPLWHTKHETASRLRGRLEKIFDYAKYKRYRKGDNPAAWRGNLVHELVKPSAVRTVAHQRAMPYTEIPEFMNSLRLRNGVAARALEWLILCAARTGATVGALHSEITQTTLKNGKTIWVWEVAPSRAGVKIQADQKPRRVPLCERAVEIFSSLAKNDGSDFLFVGGKPHTHISDMAMLKLLRSMLPVPGKRSSSKYVSHGFRSSFKDWCAEQTSYPNEVSEAALWHTVADKVEAAYRRGDLFEKRIHLMNDWAQYCAGETYSNVVPLHSENAR